MKLLFIPDRYRSLQLRYPVLCTVAEWSRWRSLSLLISQRIGGEALCSIALSQQFWA
jgi:hypothetical protein